MLRNSEILITGGTSGLGLEMVRAFLDRGYYVTALGRDPSKLPEGSGNLRFACADFGDLRQTAMIIKNLCKSYNFDFVINNAGILSPPQYTTTKNGLEITFQVNFLAHLLINEVIINNRIKNLPLMIIAVTSPVYKLVHNNFIYEYGEVDYKPIKAYSDSKYFLSLMCMYLSSRYKGRNITAISFNPGIFRSGIFRMQKSWFKNMYRIAAPFMRSPAKVANVVSQIPGMNSIRAGKVYDLRNKVHDFSESGYDAEDIFWDYCFEKIHPFINLQP